jgi:hypothetical protein
MGLIENTYQSFKTTFFGIILLATPTAAWLFFEQPFELYSLIVMILGLGLIFVPDTILSGFESAKGKYLDREGNSSNNRCDNGRYDKKR